MGLQFAGILGALGLRSATTAIGMGSLPASARAIQFGKGFVPSGQFGIGYTGGAYAGYGITNTWDPFQIHKPKYKYVKQRLDFKMPYGRYGYRRYRRYGRYRRFRRYRRYRRRYY
tara:strand:+ start:555 stop:899 length:345 start_codon:yes stop_codon:yes gene_type:complete